LYKIDRFSIPQRGPPCRGNFSNIKPMGSHPLLTPPHAPRDPSLSASHGMPRLFPSCDVHVLAITSTNVLATTANARTKGITTLIATRKTQCVFEVMLHYEWQDKGDCGKTTSRLSWAHGITCLSTLSLAASTFQCNATSSATTSCGDNAPRIWPMCPGTDTPPRTPTTGPSLSLRTAPAAASPFGRNNCKLEPRP
jgi:hypothetical protein